MKPTVAATGSRLEQPSALTRTIRSGLVWGAITLTAVVSVPDYALADEGGVSFWIPGFFGSLAAAPQQPGWSLANIDYYTNVSAGGAVALAKEFQIRNLPLNIQAQINANVHATRDLNFVIPTYVFATPVLGGQLSLSALEGYGRVDHVVVGDGVGHGHGAAWQHAPVRSAVRRHQQFGVGFHGFYPARPN